MQDCSSHASHHPAALALPAIGRRMMPHLPMLYATSVADAAASPVERRWHAGVGRKGLLAQGCHHTKMAVSVILWKCSHHPGGQVAKGKCPVPPQKIATQQGYKSSAHGLHFSDPYTNASLRPVPIRTTCQTCLYELPSGKDKGLHIISCIGTIGTS